MNTQHIVDTEEAHCYDWERKKNIIDIMRRPFHFLLESSNISDKIELVGPPTDCNNEQNQTCKSNVTSVSERVQVSL